MYSHDIFTYKIMITVSGLLKKIYAYFEQINVIE